MSYNLKKIIFFASFNADIAKPARELIPKIFICLLDKYIPFAAEINARILVKLPGPQPTTNNDTLWNVIELSIINFLIVGIIISDNSFFILIDNLLNTLLLLNKVSDKFDVLVSIEKIIVFFL